MLLPMLYRFKYLKHYQSTRKSLQYVSSISFSLNDDAGRRPKINNKSGYHSRLFSTLNKDDEDNTNQSFEKEEEDDGYPEPFSFLGETSHDDYDSADIFGYNDLPGNNQWYNYTKKQRNDSKETNDDNMNPVQGITIPQSQKSLYARLSSGYGKTGGNTFQSQIDSLTQQLSAIEQDIYQLNDGNEFNINSYKQVSKVLFGPNFENESTNKEVLETMAAAGSKISELILSYRQTKSKLRKAEMKQESFQKNREKSERKNNQSMEQSEYDDVLINGENDPLILVDASAFIFRAYHAMPPLHLQDGTPVGAVLGVCNMINKLVLNRIMNGETPRLVFVFDPKSGRNFRHDIYDEYKANRPPCPVDLIPQFEIVREAARAYGIPCMQVDGFEADDVIATLSHKARAESLAVNIVSSDKDLMQLITPQNEFPSVFMTDPVKMTEIRCAEVEEKWGVKPDKLGDVLALAGDSSDNIPGVAGIGPKIASTLINEFGSLSQVLDNAEKVPQKGRREKLIEHADKARLSRDLVELRTDIPDSLMTIPSNTLNELRMEEMDQHRLLDFFESMKFFNLRQRFLFKLGKRYIPKRTETTKNLDTDTSDIIFDDDSTFSPQVKELISNINRDGDWYKAIAPHISSTSFTNLANFVSSEREDPNKTIYPPPEDCFSCFNLTPLDKVKVVIVGQDPYHNYGQAHGLSFSVRPGNNIPPSLRNIYNELEDDPEISFSRPRHGFLEAWAKQGVFLLNSVMTVERGRPQSHAKQGWEDFTDEVIDILDKKYGGVNSHGLVFLLWGRPAQEKAKSILSSSSKKNMVHEVIQTSHPSPLGATKTNEPFLGSKCFSRANKALIQRGLDPIDWNLINQ